MSNLGDFGWGVGVYRWRPLIRNANLGPGLIFFHLLPTTEHSLFYTKYEVGFSEELAAQHNFLRRIMRFILS